MQLISIPVLLLLTISAFGQQPDPSQGVNSYTLEKEAALGRFLADDYRRRAHSVDDVDLRAYVSKVAARLNEFAKSLFPLTIEISGEMDSKAEAVGLPGGYLFVPLRLLATAQDEAQLAKPIAHALAHIATRQATRQATQVQSDNLATAPLIFMGGWEHRHADASLIVPLAVRNVQEEQEAEVVRLSAEWVKRSGLGKGSIGTEDFESMRERALVLSATNNVEPPSLRKRRP